MKPAALPAKRRRHSLRAGLRPFCLFAATALLTGCVSTAVGVVVGTTVAVGTAVVTAPVKVGAAVVGAVGDDEDEDDGE